RLGDDDPRAARGVLRDEAGVGGDRRPVVAGGVRDVHARELADRGLVLEDRLQHALAHLRLVRRVRGQELAALEDGVDDRRDVVVVDPRAEERELLRRVRVPRRQPAEVRGELLLRQRGLERELAVEPDAGGDVREQGVDGVDADGGEHLVAVGLREREIRMRHWSARLCLYASASSSASTSAASARRIRMSQPLPYGSSFTVSGASTTASFTSSTSPETALTDSTSPYDVSFATVEPTCGASKWTRSPSASCANQVMPRTASSPSI